MLYYKLILIKSDTDEIFLEIQEISLKSKLVDINVIAQKM